MHQRVDVGLIGRGASESTGADEAAPAFLEDPRAVLPAQPHAACLARQLRRHQALSLGECAQLAGDGIKPLDIMGAAVVLAWNRLLFDKGAHAGAQGIELVGRQRGRACSRRCGNGHHAFS